MNARKQPLGCFDASSALVPVSEALSRILGVVTPVGDLETVALSDGLDRATAQDVTSPIDVPPHTNSAMDGYAVDGVALPREASRAYRLVGTALAGAPFAGSVGDGETARVMTGAVMPSGTDTVVPQENAELDGGTVVIGGGHTPGDNVRNAGEDIAAHSVIVPAGTRLGPAELGVIASIGLGTVTVRRRPRVAVFSTGDELRAPGQALDAGAIYDSNREVIKAMLRRLGAHVDDMGVIRDRREDVLHALSASRDTADAVMTSGGVSTGTADYVTDALRALGEVDVWRIAIRPGRPFAFGRLGRSLFFGLPGNPVAVMVTFHQLVAPALRRLMGETDLSPAPVLQARAVSRFRKKPGRTEVYRAILEREPSGQSVVRSTGSQGSGLLHSMSVANCFVILSDEAETIEPGMLVDVQPFVGIG